ncbi:hypothetical protein AB4Z46_31430 [Variovorax sp. M-6]|uniref:hypothetical protein n=1 Tax=Variovorax sp. M-6 TaxID=3233041 RepID=UPI003F9B3331
MLVPVLLAGMVVGGGATYMVVVPTRPANPLMTANAADFKAFVPYYFEPCGEIMFEGKDPRGRFDDCARQTITQVRIATGIDLTAEDLRDPKVKSRWLSVMGKK